MQINLKFEMEGVCNNIINGSVEGHMYIYMFGVYIPLHVYACMQYKLASQ